MSFDESLAALRAAKAAQTDEARPDAVEWVHTAGRLTAHERLTLLLDDDSAVPYGSMAARDPDDGWIAESGGIDMIGTIAGHTVVASSTDFTDKGGGYGAARLERLFALAREHRWPVVFFVDGGGSRARHPRVGLGHRELNGPFGRFMLFDGMAELSGWAPTVAIVSGPSFAGHASLAGFSDFVIATTGSSIGMGGPPMVEAALGISLGANELAGVEMHDVRGGIDLLVDDEPGAIAAAKQYLGYFTDRRSASAQPSIHDDDLLAHLGTSLDTEPIIDALVDGGSFFELRAQFARSVITAMARVNGHSVGVIASRPSVNDGAIDESGAVKATRMVQLCDAYDIPILSLIDSPGCTIIDGRAGLNRWTMRAIMAHHHRTSPLIGIQIGRGGGLAPAVLGGLGSGHSTPLAWWAWPSTTFGVDDAFGAVRYPDAYDDVIDPTDTRPRLSRLLDRLPPPVARTDKKHPVDTW